MATRRRKKSRKTFKRTPVTTRTVATFSAASASPRVREAAEVIADGIRMYAATVLGSKQIPPSVHVGQGSANTSTIYANSPNAYPIETGARHPTFGMTNKANDIRLRNGGSLADLKEVPWHAMKQNRFMENGAALVANDAMAALAESIDDWAAELGYE